MLYFMRLDDYRVVGFSGSRREVPAIAYSVFKKVDATQRVLVGDASGVDRAVREYFPGAEVFRIKWKNKGAFAERSIRFVKALSEAALGATASNNGCLISFPDKDCPSGLVPSPKSGKCFSGKGSGSYATLAYAVGLNIPCFVYLQSFNCDWLEPLGHGWTCYRPVKQKQLSLF